MTYEYVAIGGEELINPARTMTYIQNHLPGLDLECDIPSFGGAYSYSAPLADDAPWITSDPASEEFYGALVTGTEGLYDSTQSLAVTELKQDGAVPGLRRNASREMRFTLALYAKTDEALQYGIDWYAHVLSGGYCPQFGVPYCEGAQMSLHPLRDDMADMAPLMRTYYDVKTLESVRINDTLTFRNAKCKIIEFILIAGNPFIYRTGPLAQKSIDETGFTTTYNEKNCDPEAEAFDQLITDPAQGDVVRPPRPPMINPVTMPSQWRRNSISFTEAELDLPGQIIYRVRISSAGAIRLLRLRFYRDSVNDACDYSGEFLITYKPGGQDMVIDGLSRKVWVERDGREVPAGNLVIGSDGRPVEWPIMDCQEAVNIRADYPSAPSDLSITVEAHNRR